MSKIAIIGAGFAGISAASYLAKAGHDVTVYEKNNSLGGRARTFTTENGYLFDMGPSWYWMPDIFERYFRDFGVDVAELYSLKLLNPSFDVVYGEDDTMHIPENFEELCTLFESIEKGSSVQLKKFMEEAEYKYKVGVDELIYKPANSLSEFITPEVLKGVLRLQVFSSFSTHVRKFFTNPKLITLMEFPVLFLGAMPKDTPALYSLMNYAGLKLGTWYPMGGFGKVIDGMVKVAEQLGVKFRINSAVQHINTEEKLATSISINNELIYVDAVIAAADYEHVENKLLPKTQRNYTDEFWKKKTFAPSCLIYYLGVKKRMQRLEHHTLFFDEDLTQHAQEIYKDPKWPTKPLFYVCCPSKTDNTLAPEGHENLFLLMPLAPGLTDTEELRESYFQQMIKRLEKQVGEEIESAIDYKRSYCVQDFMLDYNAYKGNAYGLANTLRQTAVFKPKIRNKAVKNLFYTGQLTVPGPGVPPSLISGKIAANELLKQLIP
jgi:phytoene desaturase